MKGIGFVGIVGIAAGAILIYSGFTGTPPLQVIAALLRGESPTPAAPPATTGSSGGSGFREDTPGVAGDGAGGGGGGGW